MLQKLHEFIIKMQDKVAGDPKLYFSVDNETISVTFLWGIAGLSYKRSLSIFDIVQSNLTDADYAKLLVEKANNAYETALANLVADDTVV